MCADMDTKPARPRPAQPKYAYAGVAARTFCCCSGVKPRMPPMCCFIPLHNSFDASSCETGLQATTARQRNKCRKQGFVSRQAVKQRSEGRRTKTHARTPNGRRGGSLHESQAPWKVSAGGSMDMNLRQPCFSLLHTRRGAHLARRGSSLGEKTPWRLAASLDADVRERNVCCVCLPERTVRIR